MSPWIAYRAGSIATTGRRTGTVGVSGEVQQAPPSSTSSSQLPGGAGSGEAARPKHEIDPFQSARRRVLAIAFAETFAGVTLWRYFSIDRFSVSVATSGIPNRRTVTVATACCPWGSDARIRLTNTLLTRPAMTKTALVNFG